MTFYLKALHIFVLVNLILGCSETTVYPEGIYADNIKNCTSSKKIEFDKTGYSVLSEQQNYYKFESAEKDSTDRHLLKFSKKEKKEQSIKNGSCPPTTKIMRSIILNIILKQTKAK